MAKLKVMESGAVNDLMPKLLKLKEYDADVERKRKKWSWISIISGILIFVGLMAVGMTQIMPLLVLPAIAGPVFVFAIITYIINARRDLDNRKLDTAKTFVEMIGQDVPPERNLALFIDFGDYQSAGKMLSKEGGMFSVREMTYEHPWFKCGGVLYDGNRFELEVVQCVKRKEKPKRKYTKVKEKIVEKATLSLKLNPRVYPAPSEVADQVQTGRLPHGITVSRAIGRERTLKIAAITPPAVIVQGRYGKTGDQSLLFDGDKLLAVVLDAYAGLQKSRPAEGAAQA